jgi:hypothetical protein
LTVLSDYVTQCRRLLHDANGNFWTTAELNDYINEARRRLVGDTGCLRSLQNITLTTGVETYAYSLLPSGSITMDILNITAIWGNQRIPLRYMPFTQFNAQMRPWTSYQDIPAVFSIYGQNTFYIGPSPSQNFVCEVDTVIQPNTLVDDTTVEQINYPYTTPVAYYACSIAKEKEQAYDEGDRLKIAYKQKVMEALQASMTRRIPNAYR